MKSNKLILTTSLVLSLFCLSADAAQCNETKYQPLVDKATALTSYYYGKNLKDNYYIQNIYGIEDYKKAIIDHKIALKDGILDKKKLSYLAHESQACTALGPHAIIINKQKSNLLNTDMAKIFGKFVLDLTDKEYLKIVIHELVHKYQWENVKGDIRKLPSIKTLEKEAEDITEILMKKAKKDKLI